MLSLQIITFLPARTEMVCIADNFISTWYLETLHHAIEAISLLPYHTIQGLENFTTKFMRQSFNAHKWVVCVHVRDYLFVNFHACIN